MSGRGRIAILDAILSGQIKPSGRAVESIFSCIQCGACARNCPPGINIPEVLYTGRKYLKRYAGGYKLFRLLTGIALKHPDILFSISRLLKKPVNRFLIRNNLVPCGFSLPDNSLTRLPQVINTRDRKGRVAVFRGCSTNYAYPEIGNSLIRVLVKLGYEVILPKAEVCCGTPFRTLGMEKEARAFARKNVEVFGRLKADAVISACPTCILALKYEYPLLINRGIENAMDIPSFLSLQENMTLNNPLTMKAFYHDPCHMLYGLKVSREPREILKKCGVTLTGNSDHSCCGFGGSTYSIKFRDASLRLAKARWKTIEESSAEAVFTSCPGCILQLKKVCRSVDVFHVIEAVDEAMG